MDGSATRDTASLPTSRRCAASGHASITGKASGQSLPACCHIMADRAANARRGKSGESHARVWLEGRGYTTVAANWRCPSGELDLVMLHRDELVFVEVKPRTGERFGRAAEAVTPAK